MHVNGFKHHFRSLYHSLWHGNIGSSPPLFSTCPTFFSTLLFHGFCLVLLSFLCFLHLCRVKESMILMKIHMAIHKNMKSNIRINTTTPESTTKGGAAAALAAAAPHFLLMWRPLGRHWCCWCECCFLYFYVLPCGFSSISCFLVTAKIQKTGKVEQNKTRSMKQQG